MRHPFFAIAFAPLVFNAGCATPVDPDAAQKSLLETDRQWAAAAKAGDVERLTSFWTEDAINFFPGAPPARGKEAIRELVRRNRERPQFSLTWQPECAVVARSADLGYTFGPFQLSALDAQGHPIQRQGHYVCIWKKQSDDSWKCAVESTIFTP